MAPEAARQQALAPFPVDPEALAALERLWSAGHAAFLVGGAVRDGLIGREPGPADLTTDARPEQLLSLFPGSSYTNRFGTVLVGRVEITTFRRDRNYGDHRRPDEVVFTDDVREDLERRDFTVNAIAWGRDAGAAAADFVDPAAGRADLEARMLRAVGDPETRFAEDALRLLRAARIAGAVGLAIEPATLAAMRTRATDARFLSGERVGIELRRIVASARPSVALRILSDTGILGALMPELAQQRGIPQSKIEGHDLWDHTLATVDAAISLAPGDERLAVAALLHDAGKPQTAGDGHFHGHPQAGSAIARELLGRIAYPSRDAAYVCRLIEEHMFQYVPGWSDAAVRRFMRRVGPDIVDDLLRLRQADNVGSGLSGDAGQLDELRARIERERERRSPLGLADLAIDGDDLQAELGLKAGPELGALLDRLLESVVNDPRRNTRERLLADARSWIDVEKAGADG